MKGLTNILVGGGVSQPPNSVEIEVIAAEDIKAGEFVGMELLDYSLDNAQDFSWGSLTYSKIHDFKSNKSPDGKFLVVDGTSFYLIKINENGTIETGTSQAVSDTLPIIWAYRYDNTLLLISHSSFYLYHINGLTLELITQIAHTRTYHLNGSGTYDMENRIFVLCERESSSTSATRYLRFYRFTDTTVEKLYEYTTSSTVAPYAVGSQKVTSGYKVLTADAGYIHTFTCDSNFQNWAKSTDDIALPETDMTSGLILNNIIYATREHATSSATICTTYKLKLDDDGTLTQIAIANYNKTSTSFSGKFYQYAICIGDVNLAWRNQRSSVIRQAYYTTFFQYSNEGTQTYSEYTINRDCLAYLISNTKLILTGNIDSVTKYVIIDLVATKKEGVKLTGLAKTSAKKGESVKIWLSNGLSQTIITSGSF